MPDDLSPLSLIAGAAILTNACAILQNGTTTRYHLAIVQWREFRAALAAQDGTLPRQYADPDAAIALVERRVRLQLGGLGLLNGAVALFAAATVLGFAGAFLVQARHIPPAPIGLAMVSAGGAALLLLLAATAAFFRESACARALLALHRHPGAAARPDDGARRAGPDAG